MIKLQFGKEERKKIKTEKIKVKVYDRFCFW
jgi:hypothetical protein